MHEKIPCLPLYLPKDVYARLEQQAAAEERDPVQQARWLLRQALSPEPTPPRDLVPAGGPDAAA